MYKPILTIDLPKLRDNAATELHELGDLGIEEMAVNKVFDGCVETAKTCLDGGIKTIAESRVYNLKKLKDALNCQTCLLRSPGLSEIPDVVRYADISLNAEPVVIKALSDEAVKQGKKHQVLLMIDMGDLREGIWFTEYDQIRDTVKLIEDLPGVELYGLGTNFNCYGTVMPTVKNGEDFLAIGHKIEKELGIHIKRFSAGNCTSYVLIDRHQWPKGLNHLRIGGLHEYGIEYVAMHYLDQYHHSTKDVMKACSPLYKLKAEIIELDKKPTVPVGELGVDAFLHTKHFEDRGIRKRALLAFGRQDVPVENCVPSNDTIGILGQTSDHTLIDLEDCNEELKVGDWVEFELDYTGLLAACQASGVEKQFIKY